MADDLVGVAEVAEILGVRKPNVYRIKDLPKPRAELAGGKVWNRGEIEDFAEIFKGRRRNGDATSED